MLEITSICYSCVTQKHQGATPIQRNPLIQMAPRAGLEPATWWLTAKWSLFAPPLTPRRRFCETCFHVLVMGFVANLLGRLPEIGSRVLFLRSNYGKAKHWPECVLWVTSR